MHVDEYPDSKNHRTKMMVPFPETDKNRGGGTGSQNLLNTDQMR